jgi:hypothetical protein
MYETYKDIIKPIFDSLVSASKIKNENPTVEFLGDGKIVIDYLLPTDKRLNKRTNLLIFEYSENFYEDHSDIEENTPKDKILELINGFDFADANHSRDEEKKTITYIIGTDGVVYPKST